MRGRFTSTDVCGFLRPVAAAAEYEKDITSVASAVAAIRLPSTANRHGASHSLTTYKRQSLPPTMNVKTTTPFF